MNKEKLITILSNQDKGSLENFIMSEPAFDFLFNDGVNFCGSGSHFYKNEPQSLLVLVRFFLESAEYYGAEKAAENIEKYLFAEQLNGLMVLAICGICPDKPIIINDQIKLIPYKDLPDSYYKAVFDINSIGNNFFSPLFPKEFLAMRENPIGKSFYDVRMKPTAAIIYSSVGSRKEPVTVADCVKMRQDLRNVCASLVIIDKNASTPIAMWWQGEDWINCWPSSQGGVSLEEFDLINRNNVSLKSNEVGKKIVDAANALLSLEKDQQDKLYIPLSRLNNAIIRPDYRDKAVELGIAIESVFFIGEDNSAELTYKIQLRAAKLLSDNVMERKKIQKLFKAVYGYRSRVVHGNHLKMTDDIKNNMEECILKTAQAIEIILFKSKEITNWPNFWEKLILGC